LQLDATTNPSHLRLKNHAEEMERLFAWLFRRAALRTVTADLKSGDDYVEAAIPLNLPLQTIEQVAFKFRNLATAETRHVNVVPLGTALVVVFLALHMHQIKFIDQAVPLEQAEGAVDGNAIDLGIEATRAAQQLAGVEVLLGSFDHAENGATLTGHAQSTRHQLGLQTSRNFGLWQWHGIDPYCN